MQDQEQQPQPETESLQHIFQSLPFHKEWVGILIGKGGATIKWIRESTNATIFINDDEEDDNKQWRYVKLKGKPYEVDQAKKKILGLLYNANQSSK